MDEVEQVLARLDEPTAELARGAITSLVGPSDARVPLSTVNQADLQHFLWYALPTKWLVDDVHHHEIAWAVGDFLEAAGLTRYAAICRDRRTHEILSAWHQGSEDGRAEYLVAQQQSGVLPPDTDVLEFGQLMGGEEARVHAELSSLLERAIEAGDLDPSGRGFRARARRLVEAHLTRSGTGYDGRSPLSVVHEERITRWVQHNDRGRFDGWSTVLPLLLAPPTPDDTDVRLSMAPALALLEAIGDGVTLTAAGYLPPRLALGLDERFGWSEGWIGSVRGEGDLPTLQFTDEQLRARRLLTVRNRKLTVSAEGRRCAADPHRLWRVLTRASDPSSFEADVLAMMTAVLLVGEPLSWDDLDQQVVTLLAGKWRTQEGEPVRSSDVHWTELEWYRLGIVYGWWQDRHAFVRSGLRLNRIGRAAAVALLHSVATAPVRSP